MKFKSAHLLFLVSLLALCHFFFFEFFERPYKEIPISQQREELQDKYGNRRIKNFQTAKKFARKFYEKNSFKTFYCGCSFTGNSVQLDSCPFQPSFSQKTRAKRIEWEHVVPASHFGQHFPSWKKGHKKCLDSYGVSFRGRRCARLVSKKFRFMEADLYNLVPSIGEVNALRSNYPVNLLKEGGNLLKGCETKIYQKKIQPRQQVRGMLARIYLYMERTYPDYLRIPPENRSLLESWAKENPPSKHELQRNSYIREVQGNLFDLNI